MAISVESGGILTTLQDFGRFGLEQFGVPPSGAMDPDALALANALVGNPPDAAVLEMTLIGPTLRFDEPAIVAVSGADLSFAVNGVRAERNRAVAIAAGDALSFQAPVSGCRAYLAVAGGFFAPDVLSSKSTLVKYAIGGFNGRALRRGDVLALNQTAPQLPNMAARRVSPAPLCESPYRIRVIPGPQDDRFTQAGIETFFESLYTIGKDSDRMGYRLEGPAVAHKTDGNIISDGIVTGSIQVPSDGKPIIMMNDRQTVGGYAKIATVISVDLPVLGQCKAGDKIRFARTDVETAQSLYRRRQRAITELWRSLNQPRSADAKQRMLVCVNGARFDVQIEELPNESLEKERKELVQNELCN